jgi:outer membrane protein, adhesin transport system
MFKFIDAPCGARFWQLMLLCYLPFCSHAQILSLPDAVDKTITNYPLLKQRGAEVAAGKAHLATVRGNKLPSLLLSDQLDAGSSNALQGTYLSMGIIPSTPGGSAAAPVNYNPNTGNVAVSALQWDFYNFGYYRALQRQADAQLGVDQAALAGDRYLLTTDVISLYLDWLKKFRLLDIQRRNMERAEFIYKAIKATVIGGLKPGVDSSTAAAAYADARISYLDALDKYNYDRITLATYTGSNSGISPDTSFIAMAMPQAALSAPDKDSVSVSHPLLDLYKKQYEQQVADNNALAKKYLPKVGLMGIAWERNSSISYSGTYPESITSGMPYNKFNYLMGLTFTYDLFDLRHKHDQVVEGGFNAAAKQSAMATQQVNLDRMLQQANATYATTVEKLKQVPVQLSSARQAYEQQLALYRSGLNTLLEVTNAQYVLLQAETTLVLTQDELLQLLYIKAGLNNQLPELLQTLKK